VPGILGVAEISGGLPLTGSWSRNSFEIIGRGEMKDDDSIDTRSVTPEYLAMMRIPLKRGRYLAATDGEQAPLVAVVNETAARKYWPGADPIGQRIKINKQEREIVGVVGDVHHLGPEIAPRQELYLPMAQTRNFGVTLVARAAGNAMAVLPAVKSAIWHVDREQRLTGDTLTLDGYMDRLIAQRRFNMAVLALFGLLGLLIAAVGIYGVMAYVVAQRTSEIGVRMALGATRGRVVSMVLGRASVLMAIGLAIGGAVSWYFSAGVRAFLFDVQPNDGGIFALALGTLAVAGLVASVVPARRAAGVDPLIALRSE
jgi:predicted permease